MSKEKTTDSPAESLQRIYEVGFHIVPGVSEDKIWAKVSAIKENLDRIKAVVVSEEAPRMRALSYAIQKSIGGRYQNFSQAYFGWIKFEADAAGVFLFKEALEKNENILRFLIVKTVRENTMTAPRVPIFRRSETETPKREETKEAAAAKVSEAELDKAINAAIAE